MQGDPAMRVTWKGEQRLKGGQRSGTFHPILAWILTPFVEEEHVKSLEENHARYLQEQQESFDQKMIVEDLLAYSVGDLFTKKVVCFAQICRFTSQAIRMA